MPRHSRRYKNLLVSIIWGNYCLYDLSVSRVVVEEFGPTLLYTVTSFHWCLWAFVCEQLFQGLFTVFHVEVQVEVGTLGHSCILSVIDLLQFGIFVLLKSCCFAVCVSYANWGLCSLTLDEFAWTPGIGNHLDCFHTWIIFFPVVDFKFRYNPSQTDGQQWLLLEDHCWCRSSSVC